MTVMEHKRNIVQLLEDLSEESLIALEIVIARLQLNQAPKKRRQPPASIAGKAKILGDLIAPCTDVEDVECLK